MEPKSLQRVPIIADRFGSLGCNGTPWGYREFRKSKMESVIIIDYSIDGLFYSVCGATRQTTDVDLNLGSKH